MPDRPLVYIMGPYTKGDVAINVKAAMDMANALIEAGLAPVCPHLSHFLHMANPQPYEVWLDVDMALLRVCKYAVRLPGVSAGAEREADEAFRLAIPTHYMDMAYTNPFEFAARMIRQWADIDFGRRNAHA